MDKNLIKGQKSLLTRCALKEIIQFYDINNFATSLCADFSDRSPPPPPFLPHKMYRFKYYILFYGDDTNFSDKIKLGV